MTGNARLFVAALMLAAGLAQAQEALRPEVGKPLQAAQELLKEGKYKDALAKVHEADAVADRTPYENFILDRMRASAAAAAGDDATAVKSFEAVLNSGRLQAAERLQIIEAIANVSYRAKDYAKAIEWSQRYSKEGGSSEQMNNLQASAHYLSGDYAGLVKDMQQKVQAVESSVPVVDESTLRMLAASYAKLGDDAGYMSTLEKLLVHHPKKDYWAEMLARLQNKPGFSDRLALDVYRLRIVTGTLNESAQYVEMAQLALQDGLPAEAKKVVEAGYAAGKLGTGAEAGRHQRLRDLALFLATLFIALGPTWILWARAPTQFVFDNFVYNGKLNRIYQSSIGTHGVWLSRRLLFPFTLLKFPQNAILILAFIYLAVWLPARGGWKILLADRRLRLIT